MGVLNFLFNTDSCGKKKGVRNSFPKRVYGNFHVIVIQVFKISENILVKNRAMEISMKYSIKSTK